jgi:ABC-type branched-subunit amino acid transport system substrate-binding protein
VPWIVAVVALLAAGALVWNVPRHWNSCAGPSWRYLHVWSFEDDCIGVSDGSLGFDDGFDKRTGGRFSALLEDIHKENERIIKGTIPSAGSGTLCTSHSRSSVTVAALSPWRSPLSGSRAVHELAGMYVAQWRANHLREPGGCQPYIKLVVADPGHGTDPDNNFSGFDDVVDELLTYPDLTAVVGLALSRKETIAAARKLNMAKVPIVSDLVTAVGFDGSSFANLDPLCARAVMSNDPLDRFHRVVFSNLTYLDQLVQTVADTQPIDPATAVQVTQADYRKDPFSCTNVLEVNKRLGFKNDPITFQLGTSSNDSAGQIATQVSSICVDSRVDKVFYTARAIDLGTFLDALAQACRGRDSLTVIGPSDSTRLLNPELDPALEAARKKGLGRLADGHIRLLFPASTDIASLAAQPGYQHFVDAWGKAFEQDKRRAKFPAEPAEFADTWAVNGHDALYTVAQAIHAIGNNLPDDPTQWREQVNSNLGGRLVRQAAQGDLSFDANGTRSGAAVVLRLCANSTAVASQVCS